MGLLDLTSTPPDLPDAIESIENGRRLASPAFHVRYSNPLALALILDDQACEALAVLEEATTDATRIGAVLPPQHDELVAQATAGCPSVG